MAIDARREEGRRGLATAAPGVAIAADLPSVVEHIDHIAVRAGLVHARDKQINRIVVRYFLQKGSGLLRTVGRGGVSLCSHSRFTFMDNSVYAPARRRN